jgi:hypothetical protein
MEGFTLVLLISWLILIGCFVAMFFLDKATAEAAKRRSGSAGPETASRR